MLLQVSAIEGFAESFAIVRNTSKTIWVSIVYRIRYVLYIHITFEGQNKTIVNTNLYIVRTYSFDNNNRKYFYGELIFINRVRIMI